jgi:hypothetical protein
VLREIAERLAQPRENLVLVDDAISSSVPGLK